MADLFFADLVREASWGTGAGDLALAGALPGHRSFADTVPPGARFHYCIAGVTHPGEWETGEGEIGSGYTLIRVPLASSAGGSLVDFSVGLKTVALTVAADWFAAQEAREIAIGDVDGLRAELDGKAAAAHGHGTSEVGGLEAALDGKQPLDSDLSAIAGLTSAADRMPYATGPGSWAMADLTAFGRALAATEDAAEARGTLGLGGMATQAPNSVAIGGGSIAGLSSLAANGSIATGDDHFSFIRVGRYLPGAAAYIQPSPASSALALQSPNNIVAVLLTDSIRMVTTSSGSPLAVFADTGLDLNGALSVAGTQVVASRRGGWGAPTGQATRGAFDTGTVTVAELAQRLKALIDDLAAHGLIGS